MKKVKLNKYILFVLLSFMSFLGVASAAGNALSSGESMFIPKTSYPGLTCVAVGEDNPFVLTETSSGYKVTNPEGTLPGVEGKIDCSYSGNDGSEISLPFNMVSTATGTGNFGLTADNPETDILTFIGQGEIVDISSSNEYVIIDRDNCNSTSCPIRINPDVFDLANDGRRINTTVTVKYTINGNEYTKDFNVNVDKFYGAKAYPGGVGTCGFPGDEWVFRTASLSSGSNNFGYYEGVPNAKLPDCTPTNPVVEIEFKGWSSGLTNDSRPKAIGGCTGVVPAGTSVSSGNYAACYEQKPTLQLAIAEGNIENPGDWKYSDGRGYYYVGSSTTTVTLPNAVFVGFDTDKELNTWKCVDKDGNESDKNPGDSVALDGGKCTAIIDTTHVTERDYNKRIYVNQTLPFSVLDMDSCPTHDDTYLTIGTDDSGNCVAKGKSPTPEDSPTDVIVKVKGRDQTFKFTVMSLTGNAQNGDEDFIIDTSTNVNHDVSTNLNDANGIITEVPNEIQIAYSGNSYHIPGSKVGNALIYTAYWPENGVDTGHMAFCLDPGRWGPADAGYTGRRPYTATKLSTEGADGNPELYRITKYIIDDIVPNKAGGDAAFQNASNLWRVASNVAIRLVGMTHGFSGGTNSALKSHYEGYMDAASVVLANPTNESAIRNAITNHMGITGELQDNIIYILLNYPSYPIDTTTASSNDITRDITSKNAELTGNPSNPDEYKMTYEGTLSLPSGSPTTAQLGKDYCNSHTGTTGVTCDATLTHNPDKSNSEGKEVFDFVVTLTVDGKKIKQPKTTEEKKNISFTLQLSSGGSLKDAYIATPTNGVLQRMIVFDLNGGSEVYIYFDPMPNTCLASPATDPNNCIDEDHCSTPFNKDLFKNSGCCADVTDETTYAYLIQTVCMGKCTTSSFESVCKYDLSHAADDAELYLIKEGTTYSSGSYSNNIGSCIVNVSESYDKTSSSFKKSDDNGNSINISEYNGNRYCAVTCKEDWTISMDSFGNYVGERAKAAGTWFAIEDDIFIGGARTCYTSYLDYDKYMDDLTKESNIIVDNYNIYNIYSRQYTDINKQVSDSSLRNIGGSDGSGKCVERDTCANSNPDSTKYTMSSDSGTCKATYTPAHSTADEAKNNFTCVDSSGSTVSGYTPNTSLTCVLDAGATAASTTPTAKASCPSGETNDSTTKTKCVKTVEAKCKKYGREVTFELSTSSSNVSNTLTEAKDKYTIDLNKDKVETVFGGGKKNTQTSLKKDENPNYKRKEKITCTITEAGTKENEKGSVSCAIATDSSAASDSFSYTVPQSDIGKLCKSTVTVDGQDFCKCNGTDDANGTCDVGNNGDTTARNNAFDMWSTEALKHVENKANDHAEKLSNSHKKVYEYSSDMYDCQHFELYNTADDTKKYEYYDDNGSKQEKSYANNPTQSGQILGETKNYIKINTPYNPVGSYSYDEKAFMTILGKDNILVPNIAKNDEVFGGDYVGTSNDEKDANIKAYDKYGNVYNGGDVKLSHNKIKTTFYSHDNSATGLWTETGTLQAWRDYDDGAGSDDGQEVTKVITLCTIGDSSNKFNGGSGFTNVDTSGLSTGNGYTLSSPAEPNTQTGNVEWQGGSCYQVNVTYYKSHYIKSEIANSSFYRNKGNWWQRGNDIKEHGDILSEAITNANSRSSGNNYNVSQEEDSGLWSIMGEYNVFPISLDTPRNLYQYRYSFSDIGSYSDGKLGRIMGGDTPIIKLNTRACFYEVFEEVCLCCGSEIRTYVEGSDDVTKDYPYTEPTGPYHQIDDPTKVTDNKDGILNIASSTFSLNDVASKYGSSSRETPVNWSDSSPFFYDGVTHMTNKGDVALDAIEAKGENAYSETPEYSYYLTPASLSAIRDYNASNGYDVDFNKLKVYGRYSIAPLTSCSSPTSCDWGSSASEFKMNNKIVNFRHYGSEFLEEFMYDLNAVYDGTLAKSGNDQVCEIYVTAGTDGKTISNDITNKVKSGCRWIDYISESNGEYFRLAFK